MNDEPDFFHVSVGGAERMLQVVLAAFEPSIFRPFVSGEVAMVLGVYAKHGAAKRGEEATHVITRAPALVNCKIFPRSMNSWIDRKRGVRLPGMLRRFRGDKIFEQTLTADIFPGSSQRTAGDSSAVGPSGIHDHSVPERFRRNQT